jgi:hypothetical protein
MAEYRKGYKVNPQTGLTDPEQKAGLTREEAEAQAEADTQAKAAGRASAPKQVAKASSGKGRRRTAWIVAGSVGGVLLLLIIIGIAVGGGDSGSESSSPGNANNQAEEPPPPPEPEYTGKVNGVFTRSAFDGTLDQANLKQYIETSNVWCGWKDDKVTVHVTMTNKSVEHVTANWYPRYAIEGGGVHGDGFGVVQSDGFDAGETRDLRTEQDPKGIDSLAPISACSPHFQMIESG